MKLCKLPPADAHRLIPLLEDLHALHVKHQPDRYPADPAPEALTAWLSEWLSSDKLHAIIAESPTGTVLGYIVYELQDRPAELLRCAEKRAMLHHISVAEEWRRMGVGRALLKNMKAHAIAQGATALATTYATFNTASAGLMASMGLEPTVIMAEWRAS